MSLIRCPECDVTTEPAAQAGLGLVCGACGASLWLDPTGPTRRATAAQITTLSGSDVNRLRHARGAIVRLTA